LGFLFSSGDPLFDHDAHINASRAVGCPRSSADDGAWNALKLALPGNLGVDAVTVRRDDMPMSPPGLGNHKSNPF